MMPECRNDSERASVTQKCLWMLLICLAGGEIVARVARAKVMVAKARRCVKVAETGIARTR